MRLFYIRQRNRVINEILNSEIKNKVSIIENDSGLHFILRLNTSYSDEEIKTLLEKEKIKIAALSDYSSKKKVTHDFIISYSNLDINILRRAINILNKFI